MRSNSLKHNKLMLRSERRERLEAWAASDSQIQHSQYKCRRTSNRNGIRIMDLPVPACLRSSCQKLLRRITNFGSRAPGRFRRAMSRFVASASRPEVSWILPCAADFCLMSKPALPCKRDADEKHVGARRRAGEEAR